MRQLKIVQSITNRESKGFEKYLQEIGKLDMISPEEETRLATLIHQGDELAVGALVKANLRFVVSVAKQYQHLGCSLPDLVNEGNMGLIKAARQFDITRGFKFISYAVWWIRQSVLQAVITHARMVRLPSNKFAQQNRIQKMAHSLCQALGREPSSDEIAEAMQTDVADIDALLNSGARHISLDAPLCGQEETLLIDTLVSEGGVHVETELYHKHSLQVEVKRVLNVLTTRQKEVLCSYYGIGLKNSLTLDEIGVKFGLTGERVRQIKEAAILKLRATRSRDVLKSFLCD